MAEQSKPKSRVKPGNLLGILVFLRRYPFQVAGCLGLLLVNIAIEMTLPQILGNAITGLRKSIPGVPGFNLSHALWLFLGLVTLRAGVGFVLGPMRNRLVQRTLGDIRAAIYDALQRLSFLYHDQTRSGELITRATTDVYRLQDFLFACLLLTVDISVTLILTIVLIFSIHPLLGGLTLACILPTLVLIGIFAGKLQPQWRHVHDLHGAMTTVIQENIAGVRVVKAFARENSEIGKFREKKKIFLDHLLKTVNYWAARVPLAQFVFGLSTPLMLWVGGRLVIDGRMPIGDLAKVIFYLMAIGHRLGMVGQFTNILQNASASAERILEILREPASIQSGKRSLPAGRGAVVFENVSFEYRPDKPSLTQVSFRAEPGQVIAVVGPTGSGKSTLVHLIPRFYDVSSGRVLVEGVDIRELRLEELRRAVGVIFQETFLFSASVAENIAYGNPGASRNEIERCAQLAQAEEFITGLGKGYDTMIGERGISLSGGQRQRIAIARAFLMNPRILILDDAMASVDSQTERQIEEALRTLCAQRTTFVIAHRLSTVQHADSIIVLKEGRIAEQGTHEALLRKGGFYQEVFAREIHEVPFSLTSDRR
jgi:ABC-type multidrug transport system fused ATPase/permease subunit